MNKFLLIIVSILCSNAFAVTCSLVKANTPNISFAQCQRQLPTLTAFSQGRNEAIKPLNSGITGFKNCHHLIFTGHRKHDNCQVTCDVQMLQKKSLKVKVITGNCFWKIKALAQCGVVENYENKCGIFPIVECFAVGS